MQNFRLRGQFLGDLVLGSPEDQRTHAASQRFALLRIAVFFDRRPEGLAKSLRGSQHTRHQEVHEAPQFPQVVLHRGTRKTEPVRRIQLHHRPGDLCPRVLDVLCFVERD